MWSIGVVISDPTIDTGLCLAAGLERIEEHTLVFQRSPQPLDEDVVHPAATAIHRDADASVLQRGGEGEAGELPSFKPSLPEFQPQALDALRQPLETGEVAIARANHRVTYPARFMLVAAMNPCRCGRASDPGFTCRRGPNTRCAAEYQTRLSGPLLDRIDLNIEVPAVTAADLILPPPAEGSKEVAARVARARAVQLERYAALGLAGITTNSAAPANVLEDVARPDSTGARSVARRGRRHAAFGARLSPGAAGGADARRSRRRGKSRPRASGRGFVLSRADRRNAAHGLSAVQVPIPIAALRRLIADKNSCRVSGLSRNTPSMRLVTIETSDLCTPRVVMHSCAPSTTTATP